MGLKLLEGAPDSPGYARLLAEGGRTALFSKEIDPVISLCERSIEMAKRVGNLELQTEASITLALNNKDQLECVNILEEVTDIAEANGLLKPQPGRIIILVFICVVVMLILFQPMIIICVQFS